MRSTSDFIHLSNDTRHLKSYAPETNLYPTQPLHLKSATYITPQKKIFNQSTYLEKKTILNSITPFSRSRSNLKTLEGFKLKLRQSQQHLLQPKLAFLLSKGNNQQQLNSYSNGIVSKKHFAVDQTNLKEASLRNKTIYGIIYAKMYGLRFKVQHCFVATNKVSNVQSIQQQIQQKIKQLSVQNRKLYLFHIDGNPLLSNECKKQQRVFLVSFNPNCNFSSKLKIELAQTATKIQQALLQFEANLPQKIESDIKEQMTQQEKRKYDWSKITNVEEYVNKLWENPEAKISMEEDKPTQFMKWCGESFRQIKTNGQNERNPLFQANCHYVREASDTEFLQQASRRLELLPTTHNRHKIRASPLDNLIQKVHRQSQACASIGPQTDQTNKLAFTKTVMKQSNNHFDICSEQNNIEVKEKKINHSGREMWRKLQHKHQLLSRQNIPYLVEKYGVTRYEIYKLFNLYKALEKISGLRKEEDFNQVLKKGIGRGTFDESLKHLDMHPGDQLVKGVTFFPDFINWEDFLKIVSISLRKTPEEKLEALLQGISAGAQNLTSFQIGVMVGSSLAKLFDSQQTDLRIYFTKVAMQELDPQNTGSVSIALLKQKVLTKGSPKMDIVSFLILNS